MNGITLQTSLIVVLRNDIGSMSMRNKNFEFYRKRLHISLELQNKVIESLAYENVCVIGLWI